MKNHMLVFTMDEYEAGLTSLSYLVGGKLLPKKSFVNDKMNLKKTKLNIDNRTGNTLRLTKGEIQQAAKIIQHDLQFYEEAKMHFKNSYKDISEREQAQQDNF